MKKMRDLFPALKQDVVYLDSAATTQRPQCVIDAITSFYTNTNASVHRGVYDLSEQATVLYEGARDKVVSFINASDRSEIIFTSGTTEGINFIADAWGMQHVKEGDEIVVTQVEHHANLLPWQRLAKRVGAKLRFITLDAESFFLNEPEEDFITEKTKLVSLIHTSNVLGNVWRPGLLEKIIDRAHKVGAKVLLDGAQSIPHQRVDMQILKPDFFVFSGHKMVAPTGVGVLYIKKSLHDEVEPYRVGGSMVHDASYETAHWQKSPAKFEAGTPPIAQVIGLGEAVDFYAKEVDFDALHKHESMLCAMMLDGLKAVDGVHILGNQEELKKCGHVVTMTVDGVHAHDLAAMLGMRNIAVRAGYHCVQPLAKLLDVDASVRASFYMYNTKEEVEIFLKELKDIVKTFRSL